MTVFSLFFLLFWPGAKVKHQLFPHTKKKKPWLCLDILERRGWRNSPRERRKRLFGSFDDISRLVFWIFSSLFWQLSNVPPPHTHLGRRRIECRNLSFFVLYLLQFFCCIAWKKAFEKRAHLLMCFQKTDNQLATRESSLDKNRVWSVNQPKIILTFYGKRNIIIAGQIRTMVKKDKERAARKLKKRRRHKTPITKKPQIFERRLLSSLCSFHFIFVVEPFKAPILKFNHGPHWRFPKKNPGGGGERFFFPNPSSSTIFLGQVFSRLPLIMWEATFLLEVCTTQKEEEEEEYQKGLFWAHIIIVFGRSFWGPPPLLWVVTSSLSRMEKGSPPKQNVGWSPWVALASF